MFPDEEQVVGMKMVSSYAHEIFPAPFVLLRWSYAIAGFKILLKSLITRL